MTTRGSPQQPQGNSPGCSECSSRRTGKNSGNTIGAGHVTLATRPKHRLLEERQLFASPIEGDLLRRELLLLEGDQRPLLSDQRVFLGDERCQFLGAAFQSVEPPQEFVGGTSVIHAQIYMSISKKVSLATEECAFFF
jgi:hypothetical protein